MEGVAPLQDDLEHVAGVLETGIKPAENDGASRWCGAGEGSTRDGTATASGLPPAALGSPLQEG